MEKRFIVNIDYEFQLFDSNYEKNKNKYQRYNDEFEHLFLWLEDENKILSTQINYEKEYLNFIENITKSLPKISNQEGTDYWWGDLSDLNLARKLNSKVYSHELAKQTKLLPDSCHLIQNEHDFERVVGEREQWLMKSVDRFSGIGNRVYYKHSRVPTSYPYLLEPLFSIVDEFGLTVDQNEKYLIKTFQNKNGNFVGGQVENMSFRKDLVELLSPAIDILKKYSLGTSFEIDSFSYLLDGREYLYPLVEINYRKTMGTFIYNLHKRMNIQKNSCWRIFSNPVKNISFQSLLDKIDHLLYTNSFEEGIIPISPTHGEYLSFYIVAESENKIEEMVYDLHKTLNK